jgi:hypothetical protein
MTDLKELLDAARNADAGSRIEFRNAIAAHGTHAIAPMAEWLNDPRLAAFAVRVLHRVADDPEARTDVVAALSAFDRRRVAPQIASDIAFVLAGLRPPTLPRGAAKSNERHQVSSPGLDRGRRDTSTTEERFHDGMLEIYWSAGRATGYWASYFLRAVRNKGGVATARELLRKTGTSPGFERLTAERRLDLSMEALVTRPEFANLFTPHETQIARERLADAGYREAGS